MDTFETAKELSKLPLNQQLHQMRVEFARHQAIMQNVIAELEQDLERARKNEKIPHDVIVRKDEQIDSLMQFANLADDFINILRLALTSSNAELIATNMMLWDALKSKNTAFETLMHRLVTIPKHLKNDNQAS